MKSILDPVTIIHSDRSHGINVYGYSDTKGNPHPGDRCVHVERTVSHSADICAGWIAFAQKQYLSQHLGSQVPISRDLWGRSKISRAGLSAAWSKWVIRHDTNAWCWLPAARFPAHRSWPHDTWPLHHSACIRGKWWGKRRDLSMCGRDGMRQRTACVSVFTLLHNEWLFRTLCQELQH